MCAAFWSGAITRMVGSNPPATATWRGFDSICEALQPFMAQNRNHTHLPSGGGFDVLAVGRAAERNCLELDIGDKLVLVVRPEALTLEHIPQSPIDSFLLLELAELQPVKGHEHVYRGCEELFELAPGQYIEREVWNRGYLRHNENGYEVPLPDEGRLVSRWLGGKLLIVSKQSCWNGDPGTYDGRHNTMNAARIRSIIERSLAASAA